MKRWLIAIGVGLLVLCEMLLGAPQLFAQAPGGSFEQLSPGNQKVARALFEAQPRELPPGTRRLTLDQIAARKASHQEGGWGRIFGEMRAEGRTTTKNLGQAVSASNHRHQGSFATTPTRTVTTAANRSVPANGTRGSRATTIDTPRGDHGHRDHGHRVASATSASSRDAVGTSGRGHGHGGPRK